MKLNREWVDLNDEWVLYPVGESGNDFLAVIDPEDNFAVVYGDLGETSGKHLGEHDTLDEAKAACVAWLRGHGHTVDGELTTADLVDRIKRLEETVEMLVRRQANRQEDWR